MTAPVVRVARPSRTRHRAGLDPVRAYRDGPVFAPVKIVSISKLSLETKEIFNVLSGLSEQATALRLTDTAADIRPVGLAFSVNVGSPTAALHLSEARPLEKHAAVFRDQKSRRRRRRAERFVSESQHRRQPNEPGRRLGIRRFRLRLYFFALAEKHRAAAMDRRRGFGNGRFRKQGVRGALGRRGPHGFFLSVLPPP